MPKKERVYSSEKIEKVLDLTDKYIEEDKPRSASRALTVALNYARFYDGSNKNSYLERIKQRAMTLEKEKSFEDWEYEKVQGIEEDASILQRGRVEDRVKGLLPLILGISVARLFLLSPNITGNTILNLTNPTSNLIGIPLVFIGLTSTFFYSKYKK